MTHIYWLLFYAVLGIAPRALCAIGKCCVLHLPPLLLILTRVSLCYQELSYSYEKVINTRSQHANLSTFWFCSFFSQTLSSTASIHVIIYSNLIVLIKFLYCRLVILISEITDQNLETLGGFPRGSEVCYSDKVCSLTEHQDLKLTWKASLHNER